MKPLASYDFKWFADAQPFKCRGSSPLLYWKSIVALFIISLPFQSAISVLNCFPPPRALLLTFCGFLSEFFSPVADAWIYDFIVDLFPIRWWPFISKQSRFGVFGGRDNLCCSAICIDASSRSFPLAPRHSEACILINRAPHYRTHVSFSVSQVHKFSRARTYFKHNVFKLF